MGWNYASTPFETPLAESAAFQPWLGITLRRLVKALSQNRPLAAFQRRAQTTLLHLLHPHSKWCKGVNLTNALFASKGVGMTWCRGVEVRNALFGQKV